MRIGEPTVFSDIPFGNVFHVDPYGYWGHTSRSNGRLTETRTTPHRQRASQSRTQSREIPILVEGRDFATRPLQIPIDLTNDRDVCSTNFNNNGLHSHARSKRRQSTSNHGNDSKSGESSSTLIPISRQKQYTVKEMFSNVAKTPPPQSNSPSSSLSDDVIDLCMYEDMGDSDVYLSEGVDDTLYATAKSFKHPEEENTSRKHRPNTRKFNPTPSYPVYRYLKSQLAVDGRQIDYIRGDGNCFFRALSKEIYGSEEFHNDVRQAVVDLIEKYPKEFEQFLDSGMPVTEHIKEMRKASTWASSAEIYAAATLLQREIYVLSPNHSGTSYNWMQFKTRFTYTRDTSYHPCFITLCHTHGNHYDRIAPNHGGCNCDMEPPALSGVQAYVDLTDMDCETV